MSAVHWAVLEGNVGRVRELLDSGADPNEKDDSGHTPIYLAAWSGSATPSQLDDQELEIPQLLLSRGADGNVVNKSGRSPLEGAA